jgi:CheY-like chemotaxis protein
MSIVRTSRAGTTISLWLPQAKDSFVLSRNEEGREDAVAVATSARILLVDDDDLVRETLAAQLEDMGLATLVAASGLEALALIEAGEVVDALVSDLSMPGMNGVLTIQKARALRPRLPCFLLTGYVGDHAATSATDAFVLIRKPVSGQMLAACIEANLRAIRHPE